MKKMLCGLLLSVLLVGCIPTQRMTRVITLDLTKYTKLGFFITEANLVNQEYDPIGLVSVYLESGKEVSVTKKEGGDPVYGQDIVIKKGKFIDASLEEALEMMYNEAHSKGANAIINLKYSYDSTLGSWEVTGMMVKMK
ncbi:MULTISPECIES: YbjQ family protein [Butyricimonas]|uniref:YbjQ family protein n=1 Tax=Butyricimonas TaxID=574697 RepID=UPI001D062E6E|nr:MULTISPECIES: YbjQ family protein [Butyricimonas]MCB6972538.1 YbjQ family protein [Butyricimonas synergistica]MCG4519546.1 YbjQ family protein [Butyricimonas sp. DFI.6.44]